MSEPETPSAQKKTWGDRAKRIGQFVVILLPDLLRKLMIWLGSFAIGSAPSAVLAKTFPSPLALVEYGHAANAAGVFREFLFVGVSVSGIAILNALDHAFSGQYPLSRYKFTYLTALGLIILLLGFIVYMLLAMAEMQPGTPIPSADIAEILDSVVVVVYSALAVELIFALNVARANQRSKATTGAVAAAQGRG